MSKCLGLLILWGILAGCGSPAELSRRKADPFSLEAPPGLEEFSDGRPLSGTTLRDLATRYEDLTGKTLEIENPGLEMGFVRPFGSGPTGWLLLQVHRGVSIPDVSYVIAHIFDWNWQLLSIQSCSTGYRAFITEATVIRSKELGQDLLAIKTIGSSMEAFEGKAHPSYSLVHYFAFVQGRIDLIRLEDNEQRVIRNLYTTWKPFLGPNPPTLSTPEWIDRLNCGRPAEQLSALVWLTGQHLAFAAPRPDIRACEPAQDSLKYELVRDSPKTHAVLERLLETDNPWVKEYAALGILTRDE